MLKNFYRKTLLVLISLAITGGMLFASDIVGTGTGTTKEEALKNARLDCQSQITINISALTVSERHDNGSEQQASLSQYSYQYTTFEIIGAKEQVTKEKGMYVAKTTIPEEAAPLYETRVKDLLNETDMLYGALKGREETATASELGQLFVTVRNFEIYRTVLQALAPDNPYSTKSAAITKTMAETLYRNRLMQEQNLQEQTIEDLNTRIRIGVADAETRKQLEEIKKAHQATLAEQRAMQEQSAREQELKFAEFEQLTIAALESNMNRTGVVDGDTTNTLLSSRINRIEANRKTLGALKEKLTKELDSLEREMRNKKSQSIAEISRMPYSESDYINGTLTQEARRYRENLKENAAREVENEYVQLETALIERYVLSMEELTGKTKELLDELIGTEYSFSTGDPGVSVKCDNIYLDNGIISFTITIVLGEKKVNYYYTISYEDITGMKKPTMSSQEYSVYREKFMQIYEILKNCPDFYPVTVKLAVKFDGTSRYCCRMTDCIIYTDVAKDKKATSAFNRQQEDYISFGDSFEFGNYKWISRHSTLVDGEYLAEQVSLQYKKQQEKERIAQKEKEKTEENKPETGKNTGKNTDKNSGAGKQSSADSSRNSKNTGSTQRAADSRSGKVSVFLGYNHLDGGNFKRYTGEDATVGLTYWQNGNIYHTFSVTLEILPQIRRAYIDKNGKTGESSQMGALPGYTVGVEIPAGGTFKLDATAGIKIGRENFTEYKTVADKDEQSKSLRFVAAVDLTCGLTLNLGNPYEQGVQIRGFGILSFNSTLGMRKGFGIGVHLVPIN